MAASLNRNQPADCRVLGLLTLDRVVALDWLGLRLSTFAGLETAFNVSLFDPGLRLNPYPMKICQVWAASFALLSVSLPVQGGILDFLFGKPELEVITVTDMTPAGRLHPAPTPTAPVRYVAVSLGFQDIGGIVGGDKIPPKEEMLRTITKVLAEQGFVPATDDAPPSVLLLLTWGSLYTDMEYGFNPDMPPRQRNRQQILKFIGGYKMGFSDNDFDPLTAPAMGLTFKGYDAQQFYDMASDDFYMAIVAAYDFESVKLKQRKLLWVTRISCPSRGFWLGDVMPAMMSIAGPNIGRETNQPVWVKASDKYKPEVKIGDLQLLEYLDSGPIPVIDQTFPKAKKK